MPRWVSVPGWFLDLFTTENVPLSTFESYGAEFFARFPEEHALVRESEFLPEAEPPEGIERSAAGVASDARRMRR